VRVELPLLPKIPVTVLVHGPQQSHWPTGPGTGMPTPPRKTTSGLAALMANNYSAPRQPPKLRLGPARDGRDNTEISGCHDISCGCTVSETRRYAVPSLAAVFALTLCSEQLAQSPVASQTGADDNPRSPKRRRISVDASQHDKAQDSEPVTAERSPASTENALPSVMSAQNVPASTNSDKPTHNVAQSIHDAAQRAEVKPANEGHVQHPTHPVSGVQSQNVAAKALQSQSPGRGTPFEYLPTLDKQASQVLTFLSRLTPSEAMGLSTNPNASPSREYAALRAAFDRTRRLLSPGWPFLPQQDMGLKDPAQIEIVRKANQAIFMSSIFTGEIGLRDMDRSFLAVFIPEHGKLLPAQGSVYLELKTQGFITAWRTGAAPPDLVMSDMFGPDLDKALLARRPGSTTLEPTEEDFLKALASRRAILETAVKNKTLDQLPTRYKWEDFSREISSYLITHIAGVAKDDSGRGHSLGQTWSNGAPPHPPITTGAVPAGPPVQEDFVSLAARAAEVALRSTLGLSLSDRIPDIPPSIPSTPPSVPVPNPPVAQKQEPPGGQSIAPESMSSVKPSDVNVTETKTTIQDVSKGLGTSAATDKGKPDEPAEIKEEEHRLKTEEAIPMSEETVEKTVEA
jgi:hypothetical protein